MMELDFSVVHVPLPPEQYQAWRQAMHQLAEWLYRDETEGDANEFTETYRKWNDNLSG